MTAPVEGLSDFRRRLYNRPMSVLERVGKMVRSEWNARRARRDRHEHGYPERGAETAAAPVVRKPAVVDVDGALRVLELHPGATLDEVRSQYGLLARRYYPKTLSTSADEGHAARVVLEALTDALELLEEHYLPVPPDPSPPAPGQG